MIFEGFIEGIATSVLSGGRYDTLLEKFGDALPAIGFSVKLDYVLPVLNKEESDVKTVTMCYPPQDKVEALRKAKELRSRYRVELHCCDVADIVVKGEM